MVAKLEVDFNVFDVTMVHNSLCLYIFYLRKESHNFLQIFHMQRLLLPNWCLCISLQRLMLFTQLNYHCPMCYQNVMKSPGNTKAPRHRPLWGKFTGEFPAQRARKRKKCFHLMTSSCVFVFEYWHQTKWLVASRHHACSCSNIDIERNDWLLVAMYTCPFFCSNAFS